MGYPKRKPAASSRSRAISVLHITDAHLFPSAGGQLLGVCTGKSLEAVLSRARADGVAPDLVLATGDIAQEGAEATYERFLDIVASHFPVPVCWLPGNHDLDHPMHAIAQARGSRERTTLIGGWRIVLLDSHADDVVEGHLAASELEWLASTLASDPLHHVLIAVHHPPVPVGCAWIDRQSIDNAAAFWSIVERAANVRAVVCGHVHQEFEQQRGSVRVMTSPSTCFQFLPKSAEFALDPYREPGYRYLRLAASGSITTHVRRASSGAAVPDARAAGY